MYVIAELVFKSYQVDELEPGMIFVDLLYPGTDDQQILVFKLDKVPQDQESFLKQHGYPVEFYIILTDERESYTEILAYPNQIGWFDESDNSDELYEVDIQLINDILNYYDGMVMIDVDGDTGEPTIYEDKVIIAYPEEEDDDDWDDEERQWEYMNGEYPEEDI